MQVGRKIGRRFGKTTLPLAERPVYGPRAYGFYGPDRIGVEATVPW